MCRPLTGSEAVRLADIVEAAIHGKRVARLVGDDVIKGTARSIGDEVGMYAAKHVDIRDSYLRVTADQGFETYWSVSALIEETPDGLFVVIRGEE